MKKNTKSMVGLALFTAIVVVLQFVGAVIKFGPFSITLTLVPIIVGTAMYGIWAGAWLGFVFGAVVLISGDAAAFLPVSPLGTILTVILKGMLAGMCAGLAYKALEDKNRYAAIAVAAVVCPIVNTGVFVLGCRLFFFDTIAGWAQAAGYTGGTFAYIIIAMIGVNFLAELIIDIVLCPVVARLIRIGKKS